MDAQLLYEQKRDDLIQKFEQIQAAGQSVRLKKKASNVFRMRKSSAPRLDVRNFNGVIKVDVKTKTAEVEGMATYRTIVDETLKFGLLPTVVPELATITAGGAVSGGALEASSFKYGLVHETVQSMDILLPSGKVVTATPKNEYSDLFHGLPNSYGTLGYILKLTLQLVPAKRFVHVQHYPFSNIDALMKTIDDIAKTKKYKGAAIDFVEAVGFAEKDLYLSTGTFTDVAPQPPSDYTYMNLFYRSIPQKTDDYLTPRDFIWRWDTDWYWCSSGFGMHNKVLRAIFGKFMLRSESYWYWLRLNQKYKIEQKMRRLTGKLPREVIVQDIQVPIENTPAFWRFFVRDVPILPVWFCPTRSDSANKFPLVNMKAHHTYVNVGFWDGLSIKPGTDPNHYNKLVEAEVMKLHGTKGLYAEVFYSKADFRRMYNGPAYDKLKAKYDPKQRMKDLYEKCVIERENY